MSLNEGASLLATACSKVPERLDQRFGSGVHPQEKEVAATPVWNGIWVIQWFLWSIEAVQGHGWVYPPKDSVSGLGDTSVPGGEQDPSKLSPLVLLLSAPPPNIASSARVRHTETFWSDWQACWTVPVGLSLCGEAHRTFCNCCILEERCPQREMNKGSFRTNVATARGVKLSMGQSGPQTPSIR